MHNTIFPRAVTEFAYRYEGPARAHIYMSFITETASTNDPPTEVHDLSLKDVY